MSITRVEHALTCGNDRIPFILPNPWADGKSQQLQALLKKSKTASAGSTCRVFNNKAQQNR